MFEKHIIKGMAVGAAMLALGACNVFHATTQVDAQAAAEKDLKVACDDYSIARPGVELASAVPKAGLAAVVIEAAVDPVCANQAKFADAAGTVAWVFKNVGFLVGLKAQAPAKA